MSRTKKFGNRRYYCDSNWTTKQAARTHAASLREQGKFVRVHSEKMPWGEIHHKVYKR